MLVAGIIGEHGLAPEGVGYLGDEALRVVSDLNRLTVRVRKAREQAVRVTGRDPVAVGVLHVVDPSTFQEVRERAVGLAQRESAVGVRDQVAVIAGLVEVVAAAAVGLES